MPLFKVDVTERLYYELVYIEAANKEEAKSFFEQLEGAQKIDTVDSDGYEFNVEPVTEVPDEFCRSFSRQEAVDIIQVYNPGFFGSEDDA